MKGARWTPRHRESAKVGHAKSRAPSLASSPERNWEKTAEKTQYRGAGNRTPIGTIITTRQKVPEFKGLRSRTIFTFFKPWKRGESPTCERPQG